MAHDDPSIPADGGDADDAELVARINSGDAAAFEALYRRYRDWALRVARRHGLDHDRAADAVQEAFIWLLRQFPGFELRARMTSILYPALRNAAITRLRTQRMRDRHEPALRLHARQQRQAQSEGGSSSNPAPSDETSDEAAERRQALREVMESLSPNHQEVLHLRFADGLEIAEIARALDIPAGTVKSRLHHALRVLREHEHARRHYWSEGRE